MPTENRSSNTEKMVSVPEGYMLVERSIWTEQQVDAATACITRLKGVPRMTDRVLAMAAMDAAQCTAPDIALSDLLPAAQHQGEPVAVLYADGSVLTKADCGEAFETCCKVETPLFLHPPTTDGYSAGDMADQGAKAFAARDPEVEALRAALKFYADREHYHFESGNWDTVSGEPLNILWHGDEPDFMEDGSVARAALERQP